MIRRRGAPDRAQEPDSVRLRAQERLSQVSSLEVVNWSEQAVNGFHRSLDEYRSHNDQAALRECRRAVSMLAGAVDVLEKRTVA